MMHTIGIRQRLIFTVAGVLIIINAAFWIFYHLARERLDADLDRRLIAVSQIIAADIPGEFVVALGPGDEATRTYRNLRGKLREVRDSFDLHRMMIVDARKRLLVDAESFVPIGEPVFLLEAATREMQAAIDGEVATTVVYRSADGVLYKSGFAPIRSSGGDIEAVLVAEASAAFLRELDVFRNVIVVISVISIVGVGLLGGLLSLSVVNPLVRLVRAAEDITEGRHPNVATGGTPEIRYLADAMGRMAESVRNKEEKLRGLYRSEAQRAEDIERYAQSILSSIAAGVLSVDRRGVVVVCNAEAQRILGVRDGDVTGRTYETVPALEPFRDLLAPALDRGEVVRDRHLEYENSRGRRFDLSVSAAPLHAPREGSIAMTAVMTDQTELLALQDEVRRRETLAAIGEMAAYVAHEVRNPLGSMKIHMDLLGRPNLDADKRAAYASRITAEIDRLNGIVTQFLQYAAPAKVARSQFPLSDVIDDAVVFAGEHESARPVSIGGNYREHRTRLVDADRNQLMQLFLNVIINARDSMPDGGEVAIDLEPSEGGVEVRVRDSGCGIPPEDMDKVLMPFFSTKSTGSGLGLALVQKVVENHRGRLRIESTVGEGTTIIMQLPIAVPGMKEGRP